MILSEDFHQLSFYTLAHPDQQAFIHQHIVDAQTAQVADKETKSISIVFALVGLYLAVEKSYTGREVQLAHMKLAKHKKRLPQISLPMERGDITIKDVLNTPPGVERDELIKHWCKSVWQAYHPMKELIVNYLKGAIAL